jgi:hypothetical protein
MRAGPATRDVNGRRAASGVGPDGGVQGGTIRREPIAPLGAGALLVVVVAGAGALFATYWDDAWHTDLGRDAATIPPHLLLYGSVAVVGVVVVAWGLAALGRSRSLPEVLRQPPLLLAAAGGAVTLAAAPIDAAWHAAFGRDAVLWSAPHMLSVFGTLALIMGILAGARPGVSPWISAAAAGALLLGVTVVPVMEFETDVPQFSEALYLPVLLAGVLFAAVVLRLAVPGPLPVARAVGIYALLRLAITVGLAALGRSTPDLPLAILGLAAVDLPWRTAAARYGAGAAAVSLTAWLASAAGLASVPAGAVAVVALPLLVAFLAALLAERRRAPRLGGLTSILLLAVAAVALSPARATAHDPGQGRAVTPVTLTGASDGRGTLTVTAEVGDGGCAALTPRRVVARRAGRTVAGTLAGTGRCRYAGTVAVPAAGRWFLYAELRQQGRAAEAWLPVDAGRTGRVVERRELYRPAGRPKGEGASAGQVSPRCSCTRWGR